MKRLRGLIFLVVTLLFSCTAVSGRFTKTASRQDPPERLIVWDGEENGTRAAGWSAPKEEDGGPTVSSIALAEGEGHGGGNALVWKVRGPDWKGFGWNWFSWWPSDAGTDISSYSHVVFWIRFVMPDAPTGRRKAPTLGNLNFNLSCSDDGGRRSVDVGVIRYAEEDPTDGRWHRIRIPLKDILDDEASREFNPRTVWEFGMGLWTTEEQEFSAFIDTVSFE